MEVKRNGSWLLYDIVVLGFVVGFWGLFYHFEFK